jgi:hypothetical protein
MKLVALPRKGKLSQKTHDIEHAEDFVKARRQHSPISFPQVSSPCYLNALTQ